MSFEVIEMPEAKHYCSDEIRSGALDEYPVGTILRCSTCGKFWKANGVITDGGAPVPQWRKLHWRTWWTRYKEYMYS